MKTIRTLKDDLIQGFAFLILGLGIWAPFISEDVKQILGPVLLLLYLTLGLAQVRLAQKRRKLSPEERRDLERDGQDERAQMIRDRAAWHCWTAELLVSMIVLCVMVFTACEFAYVVYWITVGHYCLFTATRWWLNRKF